MTTLIRPVTKENWNELIRLKVREAQKEFVATNLYSIAEAQFGYDEKDGKGHWDFYPFGIYEDNTPVGFLMYGINYDYPETQGLIVRLMVDENHQGKGHGKFAMEKVLEIFRADEKIHNAIITYAPENDSARKLYASFGFVETGDMLDGETVAVLHLR
jgi:diamine N-acetyltransferase